MTIEEFQKQLREWAAEVRGGRIGVTRLRVYEYDGGPFGKFRIEKKGKNWWQLLEPGSNGRWLIIGEYERKRDAQAELDRRCGITG